MRRLISSLTAEYPPGCLFSNNNDLLLFNVYSIGYLNFIASYTRILTVFLWALCCRPALFQSVNPGDVLYAYLHQELLKMEPRFLQIVHCTNSQGMLAGFPNIIYNNSIFFSRTFCRPAVVDPGQHLPHFLN